MKLRQLLLPLFLLPLLAFAQGSRIIPADRVIAVVNNEAVTQYDLGLRMSMALQQLRSQNISPPSEEAMTKQVLDHLILDRIQLQYAKETGLTLTDSELDTSIRRIAESNNISVPDMRTSIEHDGLGWNQFRQGIREQIVISRLRDRMIDSIVNVSDGEIDNYLANPPDTGGTQVSVAHILIRVPEQPSPEQLAQMRARAEQALAQVRGGEEFGKVAATFSDAPDALSGGVLGLRPIDRLPSVFVDAVNKLEVGSVSEILRSPAGFHVVKLIERKEARQGAQALKQTHARHILIKVSEITSEADAQRKMATIKERLDHGENFADLARLYSDDFSASKGGDLGWLYQGDTVPEFERAMDDLAINEISKPVQTQFGFHLIQVLERRVDEGSKDRQRMAARMALKERKAEEAYQDWLRQLRDQAYVEYRLEQ